VVGRGTLHFGWVRLALGRRSPSRTNSSSFLSVTEEWAQASARRIWLWPAIVVGGTTQAKERWRCWTVAKGRKMAKGVKKGKEGKNAKGL
jgi:hypothetical protein